MGTARLRNDKAGSADRMELARALDAIAIASRRLNGQLALLPEDRRERVRSRIKALARLYVSLTRDLGFKASQPWELRELLGLAAFERTTSDG